LTQGLGTGPSGPRLPQLLPPLLAERKKRIVTGSWIISSTSEAVRLS
jgi:hypothetical protein